MPKRKDGHKDYRYLTKGRNVGKAYKAGTNAYTKEGHQVMQRIRNTWGLRSYNPEFLIKEFEYMLRDQDNKTVISQINREIDRLKQFVKKEDK